MVEDKQGWIGLLSSVFGDAGMNMLAGTVRWGEFMHSESIWCALSSRHARNSFLVFIN